MEGFNFSGSSNSVLATKLGALKFDFENFGTKKFLGRLKLRGLLH